MSHSCNGKLSTANVVKLPDAARRSAKIKPAQLNTVDWDSQAPISIQPRYSNKKAGRMSVQTKNLDNISKSYLEGKVCSEIACLRSPTCEMLPINGWFKPRCFRGKTECKQFMNSGELVQLFCAMLLLTTKAGNGFSFGWVFTQI